MCWTVDTRKVVAILRNGGSAKDIGWALLSDSESIEKMDSTQHGNSSMAMCFLSAKTAKL